MAGNTTTTSILSAPVQQSFSYKLLAVPTPTMIHKIPAMLKRMPARGGRILRMRRYNPLPTSLVPLGNSGVDPAPTELTAVDIDARMDFYGQYIRINEQVTLQSQDPVLNEAAQRLGVALRQSEDELCRNMLAATASFINCTGGINGDNPTEISRPDVNRVIRTLANNNAYTITQNIEGRDRFGTSPVPECYFAMANTQLLADLYNVSGFAQKANYPSPNDALPSEWGNVANVRFLLSSIGSTTPAASENGATVFNIFCTGLEAYAAIEQDQYSASFIYRPPIYDSALALNCTVGYKFGEVPRILNDLWILNLRATLAS